MARRQGSKGTWAGGWAGFFLVAEEGFTWCYMVLYGFNIVLIWF
jgi:hypothetical protein